MPYNTGQPEDLRKALDSFSDYNKLLITIATGTVALSAVFLKDIYKGVALTYLIWSWALLGVSFFLGVVAVGQYINQLAESQIKVRRGLLEVLSLLQFVALMVGLGCFGVFAVQNATQPSNIPSKTSNTAAHSTPSSTSSVTTASSTSNTTLGTTSTLPGTAVP
jgi:hypothetical protein